jgi:transposase
VQQAMKACVAEQKLNLYYYDESGFSTTPSVPYAWQPKGETIEIPCFRSKRLNVLGFMSLDNQSFFQTVEGSVNSQDVIAAFDAFTLAYQTDYLIHKKPCVVIIDNASIHTSAAFLARLDDWMARGVGLHYLPTYSPELNLIEILWRKIKYEWLPLSCYISYENLKKSVLEVLANFGLQYKITFG